MREIKFRAWSLGNRLEGIEPHYIDDFAIDAFYGTPVDIFDGNKSDDGIECIEQYTGLKDKNGREIYEGDILQQRGLLALTKVVWDENHAEFQTETINQKNTIQSVLCFDVVEADLSEVIGNIHENPELLGGEK